MVNTFVATAAAALSWMLIEQVEKGKPSLLGIISGAIAGLVAVTPAAGLAGPMGSVVLGFVAGAVCFAFCTSVKNRIGYDDALDVFGVHCVGGIIGAIATGVLAAPALGGAGIFDYEAGKLAATYDMAAQVWKQSKAVLFTIAWSGIGSLILFKLVDAIIGLRPAIDIERQGLDIIDHGERAYNY
jgi:Amt family ammonium transporter